MLRKISCLIFGHGQNYTQIDKLTSEKHPASNKNFIYTININKCNSCGLHFNDIGVEFRK